MGDKLPESGQEPKQDSGVVPWGLIQTFLLDWDC
jgi:hypothetical protein